MVYYKNKKIIYLWITYVKLSKEYTDNVKEN